MTIAETLATFTAGITRENVPDEVWAKAHACLLNGYGIALAGLGTPYEPVARKAVLAMYGTAGEATLLGSGEKTSVGGAILANGALFHGRGQEDTCGAAHLGPIMIPLLMALIESGRGEMDDLIPAMIAGYEVGGLFEELLTGDTTPKGFRATTVYGVGAAAASVARLFRMDPERTCAALGNAVSFSGGILQTFAEGTDEWRYQVGVTAQAGWTAAELARAGSLSLRQGYEGAKGLAQAFAGRSLDAPAVIEKIGRDWQTLRVAFKPFPVCAFNQTPVITVLKLRDRLPKSEVESARVYMNPYECGYAGMDSKGPFSTIGGTLMSIPFCIAQSLLRGAPSMAMMTDYDDTAINALVAKIDLVPDATVAVLSCRIELAFRNGETLIEECRMTPQDYSYSFEELKSRLGQTVMQENISVERLNELAVFCSDPGGSTTDELYQVFARAAAERVRPDSTEPYINDAVTNVPAG